MIHSGAPRQKMRSVFSFGCMLCRNLVFNARFFRIGLSRTTSSYENKRCGGMASLACFSSAADSTRNQATVFALSSGHGKCGVAVIRLSGPSSYDVIMKMAKLKSPPKPRCALLRHIEDPSTDDVIDKGLVIWFPGPRSFTGEDSAEFHVHGGPSVVAAMLTALGAMPGLRHAQPGEFTKRAFENGKLDLTEVEGLADLIHAQTEAQRRQALRQMDGHLSVLYRDWRSRLLKCLANTEAFIDFGEDEGIEDDIMQQVQTEVQALAGEIKGHLQDNRRGERLRSGVRVAILGRPNVGKSSLLNQMCQRPAAIVSPIPGTTRDVVESTVDIGGYPVLFSDTAGLRETEDIVESEGVRRALQRAEEADVRVIVLDAQSQWRPGLLEHGIQDTLEAELQELGLSPIACQSSSSQGQDSAPLPPSLTQETLRHESQTGHKVHLHSHATASSDLALKQAPSQQVTSSTSHSAGMERGALGERDQVWNEVRSGERDKLKRDGRVEDKWGDESSFGGKDEMMDRLKFRERYGMGEEEETRGRDEVLEVGPSDAGGTETVVVFNKLDLLAQSWQGPMTGSLGTLHWSCVSCLTGQGISEFSQLLASRVKNICGDPSEGSPSLTAARHRTLLTKCLASLDQFWAVQEDDCVLAAEHLRRAASSLGKVIGHISTEDILDVIFRDFCIGK